MTDRIFRLEGHPNADCEESPVAVVTISEAELPRLAQLRTLLKALGGELGALLDNTNPIESLSLWNCFQQSWYDDLNCEVDDVEELSEEQAAEYEGQDELRLEYDIVQLDSQGITFQADLRHTDITIRSEPLTWETLLGGREIEAAPPVETGAVEMIARAIADTGDREDFDAALALSAIAEARKNLDIMEREVRRIVARKLPS